MLKTPETKVARTTLADLLRAIARTGISVGARFAQVWRHRRDLALLARFDDHMLADIGLTRSDLRDAMAEPRWRDPSVLLEKRLDERRSSHSMIARLGQDILGGTPVTPPNADRQAAVAVLTW
jgi:uncharacterized protein YjiS (DUF1127 family)